MLTLGVHQDAFLLTTFVFLSYVHFSKKLCINLCINLKLCEESATCKDKPEELKQKKHIYTAWKVSKYGVISSPYFPVFGLNTEIYFVNLHIPSDTGKYGPEITPYLDTFHAVIHQEKQ